MTSTTTKQITEGQRIESIYADACPVHGGDEKKSYEFGRYGDAEVFVFVGCKCAVCERHDAGLTEDSTITYHGSYGGAEGVARLHCGMANVKYR